MDDKDLIYEGIATINIFPLLNSLHGRQRPDLRRDCDMPGGSFSNVPASADDKDLIYEGIATCLPSLHNMVW